MRSGIATNSTGVVCAGAVESVDCASDVVAHFEPCDDGLCRRLGVGVDSWMNGSGGDVGSWRRNWIV